MKHLGWILLLLGAIPLVLAACTTVPPSGDDDDDDDSSPPADYGPENSWWHATVDDVPDGLAGTGWGTGDTAYNFTLVDQFGDELELYQFYGLVIVLDLFTEW